MTGYWMLRVNDTPLEYEPGMTVRDVLRRRNYIWRMIAVFINGELVGRPADVAWAMAFPGYGP